jgi:hypothetical protein
MYSNAKDDNHLSIIFSQNFPRKPQRINILINYENSELYNSDIQYYKNEYQNNNKIHNFF